MAIFSKKTMSEWVGEYSQSHQHPVNKRCHYWGIPLILVSLPLFLLAFFSITFLAIALALFVIGWTLQFIGHYYERKAPEFFKDWRFLFVGVRWWRQHVFK